MVFCTAYFYGAVGTFFYSRQKAMQYAVVFQELIERVDLRDERIMPIGMVKAVRGIYKFKIWPAYYINFIKHDLEDIIRLRGIVFV